MNGTTTVKGRELTVDQSFSEILEHLQGPVLGFAFRF